MEKLALSILQSSHVAGESDVQSLVYPFVYMGMPEPGLLGVR